MYQTVSHGQRKRKRGRVITVLIVILLLIAAFLVGCQLWQSGKPGQPEGESAPFDPAGAVVPGGTIKDGATVVGDVKNPFDRNTYDLIADDVQFSLVEATGNLSAQVIGAQDAPATIPGGHQFGVKSPGHYKLEVTFENGRTGSYKFRLVTRKPTTLAATVDQEVRGRIDIPGRVNLYKIEAGPVNRWQIDGAPCEDITAGFADPDDIPAVFTPALLCWGHISHPASGPLILAVWSENGKAADYTFRLRAAK